jgi:TPR repeat protein
VNKKVISKAKNGDGASYFAIGNIYFGKKEYTKAINWYYLGADKNHPGSQYELGYMFTHGQGVSVDYKLGMEWYLKADSNGDINAADQIGYSYAKGRGVRIDNIAAFKWIRKAVDNGCRTALYNLGHCHEFGLGTIVDRQCALEYYQKSAELGDDQSKQCIKILNEQGFYIDIKQASTCWVIFIYIY